VQPRNRSATAEFCVQLTVAFVAYFVAGKLGQATTNIRSSNLGPVWPAYGIALASFLAFGLRVWPAIATSAFLVAASSVPALAAVGQAAGATGASALGTFLLRRSASFDPALARLRDALAFIAIGAFGSGLVSSSIGTATLYETGIQTYSGLGASWLIYWLGDSTGALLVTPLVFALPSVLAIRSRVRFIEMGSLIVLLTVACFVVFGDWSLVPIRLHALAFAVLPFVMWGAIDFGMGGATLSVAVIATIATLLTALGFGPFAVSTPFTNAVLLDVLFGVLAVSGISLAAVITEREQAVKQREQLIREQAALEARLRVATIVESSDDGIFSLSADGYVQSWNRAASMMFGVASKDAVGQRLRTVIGQGVCGDVDAIIRNIKAGNESIRFETTSVAESGQHIHRLATVSPLRDATGQLTGMAWIVRDISDHKRAEEVLSSVNRRLIEAQEHERARIGRELHDDIGQQVAVLSWQLRDHPKEVQDQASKIATDIHTLCYQLHPARLELLGLVESLKALCRELGEQGNVEVVFHAHNVPEQVAPNAALPLFRVAQEALHNAVKHSGVRHFSVRLWAADGCIHLVISDPGVGFDVAASDFSPGIGLVTMRERIKAVQGVVVVESQVGHGTTVQARVPLSPSSMTM
jgi:PAS domain S-box-containing protein